MSCHAHALAASRRMLVAEDVDLIQETLRHIAAHAPPGKILNVLDLGAGSGTTALSALEAGPDVRVASYDGDPEMLNWTELAVINIGRRGDWTRCETWNAIGKWLSRSGGLDFAMVDYEPTRLNTLETVHRLLGMGLPEYGAIWIHGYGDPGQWGLPTPKSPGVAEAVDDLIEGGWVTLAEVRGLGAVLLPRVGGTTTASSEMGTETSSTVDLDAMKVVELRELARAARIKGYGSMSRAALLEALRGD